jgi:hypothetical protein
VRIVKRFLEQSLTPALADEVGPVSLAHFDADLFSATETALNWVDPLLHGGSLPLFDESDRTDDAEARAFAAADPDPPQARGPLVIVRPAAPRGPRCPARC